MLRALRPFLRSLPFAVLALSAWAQAPQITQRPLSRIALEGDSVSFAVAATGAQPLSYTWIHNGTVLDETTGTLSLDSATLADRGWYHATVSNAAGSATSVFHLDVGLRNSLFVGWGGYPPTRDEDSPLIAVDFSPFSEGFALGLTPTGTVVGWGSSYQGHLNIPTNRSGVVQVATGLQSYALKGDGSVVSWGGSTSFEFPSGLGDIVEVSSSSGHTLALRADGTVTGWGSNSFNQITPPAGLADVVAVAAGEAHSLALRADGTVVAWGYNAYGATEIPAGLVNVRSIFAGSSISVAIKQDGTVAAWGRDDFGSLEVPENLTDAIDADASYLYAIILRADGTALYLGQPSTSLNRQVPEGLSGAVRVMANGSFSGALIAATPPQILGAPTNLELNAGENLELTVSASGAIPLNHQWKFNGNALTDSDRVEGAATANLFIANLTAADAGVYTVEVTNKVDTASSLGATLTVKTPPRFIQRPRTCLLGLGESRTFTASVEATGSVDYVWKHLGEAIPGATAASFSLTEANLADGGFYEVFATDDIGTSSSVFHVHIAPALSEPRTLRAWGEFSYPSLTEIPTNGANVVKIVTDETQALALHADGTVSSWGLGNFSNIPPEHLTDVVDIAIGPYTSAALTADGRVRSWGDYFGENWSATKRLTHVVALTSASSHLAAVRSDGTVWTNYRNVVDVSGWTDVIAAAPHQQEIWGIRRDGAVLHAGNPYVISDPIVPSPETVSGLVQIDSNRTRTVARRSDGSVIGWGDNSLGLANPPQSWSDVLTIDTDLALHADGTLTRWGPTAGNPSSPLAQLGDVLTFANYRSFGFAVVAARAPTLPDPAETIAINSGKSLTLAPTVRSGPAPSYQWLRDEVPVGGATSPQLQLTGVSAADNGDYVLVVTNDYGTTRSATITVAVVPGVTITARPLSRLISTGDSTTFTATASGQGALSYEWRHNGKILLDATSASLNLADVTRGDRGRYEVWITDEAGGTAFSVVYLEVAPPVGALIGWGFDNAPPPGAPYNFAAVEASRSSGIALRADGTVATWSYANYPPPQSLTDVVAVAQGQNYALGLKSDGTVVAWPTYQYTTPPTVPAGLDQVVAIAVEHQANVALRADGTVVGWGNSSSQISQVPADLDEVVAIGAGYYFGVAMRRDGSVTSWGASDFLYHSPVLSIDAGWSHTLLQSTVDTVELWQASGIQLEFESALSAPSPRAMSVGSDNAFVVDGAGHLHATNPPLVDPAVLALDNVLEVASGEASHVVLIGSVPSTPEITRQPESRATPYASTVTFAVEAVGSPILRYQWFKDGSSLEDETAPTLTLTDVLENAAGLYSVEVSNGFGTTTSALAELTVLVTRVTTSGDPTVGGTIILSVNAAPDALAYQWRFRGTPIDGETGSTLTLNNLSRAQNGFYDVVITTAEGERTAHAYSLDVASALAHDIYIADETFAPWFEREGAGEIFTALPLPDGTFLVGGNFTRIGNHRSPYLARFLADGNIDSTFIAPSLNGPVHTLHRTAEDLLYVGGDFTLCQGQPAGRLIRLTSAFQVDPTFNVGTGFDTSVFVVTTDAQGKVLVGGDYRYFQQLATPRLARLNPDGTFERSLTAYSTVRLLQVLKNGRIMTAGGDDSSRGFVSLLNADGSLDWSWGQSSGAIDTNQPVYGLHPLADGGWIVVGGHKSNTDPSNNKVILRKITATGAWATDYIVPPSLANLSEGLTLSKLLPDGRLLVAGPRIPLTIVNADGSVATRIDSAPPWSNPLISGITTELNGSLRVWARVEINAGQAAQLSSLVLTPDLTLASTSASFGFYAPATVYRAVQDGPGTVLLRGDFTHVNGCESRGLVRLNTAGEVDPMFSPTASLARSDTGPVLLDGLGRVILHDGKHIVRLLADGSLDASFNFISTHPGALAIANNGNVYFTNRGYDGENGYFGDTEVVRRLLNDGSIDPDFNPAITGTPDQLLVQPSGRILIGGFVQQSSPPVRIREDGSLDFSYSLGNYNYHARLVPTGHDELFLLTREFYESVRHFDINGRLDPDFNYYQQPDALAILPLADGSFFRSSTPRIDHYDDTPWLLGRHFADGLLDESFRYVGLDSTSNIIRQILQLDDGSLWLVGDRLSANGAARGGVMRLRPAQPLAFAEAPVTTKASPGGTATFSVTIEGEGPFNYQWYRDQVAIIGATGPTLELNNLSLTDVAAYHVVVSDRFSTLASNPVVIVGPHPAPRITTQPNSTLTSAGHPVTLSVEASGVGELAYQWRRSGYAIPHANGASFTIPAATRGDASIYDVVVSDGLSVTISNGVRIDVAPRSYPTTLEVDPSFVPRFEVDGGTINAILPTTDGKFIVSGDFSSLGGVPAAGIARVNAAFEVDPGFTPPALTADVTATDSGYATAIKAMAVLPDGRILATHPRPMANDVVTSPNVLVRFHPDGTLDSTFTSTAFQHNASTIAVQSDGRVVVIGHYLQSAEDETPLRLYRLHQDGSLDTSFQPPTFTYYDSPATPNAVALQSTGKIVVAGNFHAIAGSTSVGLARLNSDGSIDPNFAPNGFTVPSARQVVVDRHDNLWLAGQVRVGNLNRWFAVFDQDGNLRTETGPFSSWSNAVLQVAADQTLWAANYRSPPGEVRLWRQTGDFTFAQVGQTIPFATNTFNFTAFAFSVAPDGSMMVTHRDSVESATVVRQVSAAQPTGQFLASTRREAGVAAATHGPSGTVYVTGEFTHLNGLAIGHLARLRADGSVDSSFHTGTGFDRTPATVVKAPDGGVYVLGDFSTYNGQAVPRLVHLLPNGTLDSTFVVTATAEQLAVDHPLTVLRDGRLLLSGNVCLLPSGEIDPTFHNYLATTNRSVALTNGGAILVHRIDGNTFTLPIDSTGNPDSGLPTQLKSYSLALLPDEGLFVGGYQTAAIGRSDFPAVKRMLPPDLRTVDPTFEFAGPPAPVKSVSSYRGPELLAQEDGRVILFENRGMWRFNTDGSLDQTFSVPGVSDLSSTPLAPNPPGPTAADVLLLDDGRLLIADDKMNVGGYRRRGLVVLRSTDRVIITEQPADHSTYTGDPLSLTAETSATAGLAYQWFKDGQAIDGETSATLERTALQPNDAGRYHVVITSPTGASVTSATAQVIVATPIAPTFTIQPRSHSAANGDSLTLRALATGDPAPSYQWRHNGQDIADAHYSTLILSNVTAEDVGTYSVVATNRAGSTGSNEVTVSVYPAGTHARQQLTEIQRRESAVIVEITNSFSSETAVTSLDWEVLLPSGWTYTVSTGTDAATTSPSPNDSELLIWSWKSGDLSELNFTYTITKPLAAFEPGPPDQLVTLLTVETAQYLVQPDPLLLRLQHSADVDGDNRLSLSELLRVIELYNTRAGTSRTGRYRMQSGTADGFAPETTNGSPMPTRFHSADFDRDGQLSLSELLRVIELYNTRTGTSRTGRYRFATDSSDGFSPDP